MVGTAFYQTHPDFLDDWAAVPNSPLRIQLNGKGTFHPKVYVFVRGAKARVLVGSSNFTSGGLGVNTESNVLIQAHREDQLVLDALLVTQTGVSITPEWLAEYWAAWERQPPPPPPPPPPPKWLPGESDVNVIATALLGQPAHARQMPTSRRLFSCRVESERSVEVLRMWSPQVRCRAGKWWFKTIPSVESSLDHAERAVVALRLLGGHVLFVRWSELKAGAAPDKDGRRYLDVWEGAPTIVIAREGRQIEGLTDPAQVFPDRR